MRPAVVDPGEPDLVDSIVSHECGAGLAPARHDVQNTGGQTDRLRLVCRRLGANRAGASVPDSTYRYWPVNAA
jgi:hypothetical protein